MDDTLRVREHHIIEVLEKKRAMEVHNLRLVPGFAEWLNYIKSYKQNGGTK